MLLEALHVFTGTVEPEVIRLRNISVKFFILWITELVLGIYCECLTLNVNACVALNTWIALAAAALSYHYNCSSQTSIHFNSENKEVKVNSSVNGSVLNVNQQKAQDKEDVEIKFCIGYKRLHVLISFGSTVFVLFGCLTVIGESLQHAGHEPDTSPLLIITIGIIHTILFTIYSREIDAYDRISGQGIERRDACNVSAGKGLTPTRVIRRRESNLLFQSWWISRVTRTGIRAFAPLTCIMICIIVLLCESHLWEVAGALFLAGALAAKTIKEAQRMAWLLVNNAIKDISSCDRAMREVKFIDGVLQIYSAKFWEVSEGEVMALVRLRLTSTADLSNVTTAARRLLETVATHVFIEAGIPGDNDNNNDNSENENNSEMEFHESGSEHAGHGHSHEHNCGHHHNYNHHNHNHEHHGHLAGNEHQRIEGEESRETRVRKSVNNTINSSNNLLHFPQPPSSGIFSDHIEHHGKNQASFSIGNRSSTTTTTPTFNFVPPPFPKPPL